MKRVCEQAGKVHKAGVEFCLNGVLTSPQRLLPEVNHSPFFLAGITKSRKNLFCSLFCFLCLFLKFVYV